MSDHTSAPHRPLLVESRTVTVSNIVTIKFRCPDCSLTGSMTGGPVDLIDALVTDLTCDLAVAKIAELFGPETDG